MWDEGNRTLSVTLEDGMTALRAAVDKQGPDYVYPAEWRADPLELTGGCRYVTKDGSRPACLIGAALAILGVPVGVLAKEGDRGDWDPARADGPPGRHGRPDLPGGGDPAVSTCPLEPMGDRCALCRAEWRPGDTRWPEHDEPRSTAGEETLRVVPPTAGEVLAALIVDACEHPEVTVTYRAPVYVTVRLDDDEDLVVDVDPGDDQPRLCGWCGWPIAHDGTGWAQVLPADLIGVLDPARCGVQEDGVHVPAEATVERVTVSDEAVQRADPVQAACAVCWTPLPSDHPRVLTAVRALDGEGVEWPAWSIG